MIKSENENENLISEKQKASLTENMKPTHNNERVWLTSSSSPRNIGSFFCIA